MLSFSNWDIYEGRSHSHYLLGRKQNTSLCSLVCCYHLGSLLTDPSFLLSPGEGSHASLPHGGLGKQAGKSFGLSGNPHRKRGMDFKDLNKKKISQGKCHWKVKKALSTISFRLCFLLFWVSEVNQRNRAESWDYWEQLQLSFQSLPTYFKEKQ